MALILDAMIFGYLDRIGRCCRPGQVADALAQETARMGLSAVACWMLTGPKAASRNPFYANNWPRPWLDLYERRGFFEKDPFARWAISSGAPVSWAALLRRLPANDPGHEIGLAARNFGFREGFGTPVRSSTGHLGLFTFFGDRRPLASGEQIFLQAICPGTLHRMEALAPAAEPARPAGLLSARERQCAALLCEGLSNPAIAHRLGITVATVKFHLANACAKLGARSRAQLAALMPATAKGAGQDRGPARRDGTILLRSADGRYFEIDGDVALDFEVRHADPAAAEPRAAELQTAAGDPGPVGSAEAEAANDVEPYWERPRERAADAPWPEHLPGWKAVASSRRAAGKFPSTPIRTARFG